MILKITEKILLFSMKMDHSPHVWKRIIGKLTGIVPVWYAERMEKKYLKDEQDEN